MQSRTKWWLISILVLVVGSLVGVLEPIKLRDRRNPDTGKPVPPLTKIGPFRIYRPHIGLTLGLDLRGGSHMVLQVQREGIHEFEAPELKSETPLSQEQMEQRNQEIFGEIAILLSNEALGTEKSEIELKDSRIIVRSRIKDEEDQKRQGEIMLTLLKQKYPKVELKTSEAPPVTRDNLNSIKAILRNRVDAYGVTEPVLQIQGNDRLIVELPGIKDPEKAKELIRKTAILELRWIPRKYAYGDDHPPTTSKIDDREEITFTDPNGNEVKTEQVIKESPVIVSGRDLKANASRVVAMAGQRTAVTFALKGDARNKFGSFTRRYVNYYLAIVLDERMIMCPKIEEAIPKGEGQITGFDRPGGLEEARDLAILLNAGALPFDLEYVENRTISSEYGMGALEKSLFAGMIGMAAVLLFMAFYYRLPGLMADLALIIYCILLMGAMKLVNQVLTLPGILAVIISIGMAVDANVIIFERLKEELRTGKTLRSAVEAAFKRAWAAILDSNVCSIGTGIVLFYFGTGPIKGFAVALVIGVAVSLFTAVTVTRLFMNMVVDSRLARNLALFGVSTREAREG